MKLIIQIPCLNEAETLPETLLALPRSIDGIDTIEYLIMDDGSSDDTSGVARRFGAHHIIRHTRNRGLAAAYQTALNASLAAGADIIVNTDADNQYDGRDIETLVRPILNGEFDLVIGDRQVSINENFGGLKQKMQVFGSSIVQRFAGIEVTDAVSGFRAINRKSAQKINIVSSFSYTTEMLIQAGRKRMAVTSVPIRTNAVERPSRLFNNIPQFVVNQAATILRAYTMYNPLKAFMIVGCLLSVVGAAPILRFIYFFMIGNGAGHVQSLVIGGSLFTLGTLTILMGVIADLIGRNRQLTENVLERLRIIEENTVPQTASREAEFEHRTDLGSSTNKESVDSTVLRRAS